MSDHLVRNIFAIFSQVMRTTTIVMTVTVHTRIDHDVTRVFGHTMGSDDAPIPLMRKWY